MSVTGADELQRKLNKMSEYNVKKAVSDGIQTIRSTAVLLCPVDLGELRQSIYASVEERGDTVVGTCWTNKAYAIYVEFGTGPKGMANHQGVSPDVTVAYSMSPWWIHESMIDRSAAEKYHWFKITTKAGIFYRCSGQAAQPFMYPALANNRERLLKGIKTEFHTAIEEIIK